MKTFYAGGTFGGVSVASGDVIIMYTYAGDANLDGLVDAADYGYIDNYFQFPGSSGYANGDFNYDGIIDAGDYGIIDNAFQLQGTPFPTGAAAAGSDSATVSAVPEPSACALAMIATCLLCRRSHTPSPQPRSLGTPSASSEPSSCVLGIAAASLLLRRQRRSAHSQLV
jgi:hypothetical protein